MATQMSCCESPAMPSEQNIRESRVLLIPPTRRDGEVIFKVLQADHIICQICSDLAALCSEVELGAGVLIVSEESLNGDTTMLVDCVKRQPVWSDLALLVLSPAGRETPGMAEILHGVGDVTVVERPVRISTLLSLVRSALRARQRQYQVRAHLDERRAIEESRTALLDAERAARVAAERAGRLKDEFLATLSHELRTPLSAILGWSSLLTRPGTDPRQIADGLKTIERNARAQTQIIEDLLDMSRIISGKLNLTMQPVNLTSVVQAAIATVQPAAQAKGVRLSMATCLNDLISGDPDRLQQVFWNLLSNAVKFTPKGRGIEVKLRQVGSNIEIQVIDGGEGISPEFLPHIFDRFRQADGSSTRRHGGLGLGLAIVKQLVELHGGTVLAASDGVGKGATLTVSLPMALESSTDAQPSVGKRAFGARTVGDPSDSIVLSGVSVLVVDDEPDSRTIVARLLESRSAKVTAVGSVRAALSELATLHPDVIVSDIGMPDEDGYHLIRTVRSRENGTGRSTPAIALTAYARGEDRDAALAAGFNEHLSKPVEQTLLFKLVQRFAQNRAAVEH